MFAPFHPAISTPELKEIRRRLILVAIASGIGLMAVAAAVALIAYMAMKRQTKPWIESAINQSISSREELLHHFCQISAEVAKQIAVQATAKDALIRYERGDQSLAETKLQTEQLLAEPVLHASALRGFVRVDRNRQIIASLGEPPDRPLADWDDARPWVPMVADQLPVLRLITPITDADGQLIGSDLAFFGLHSISTSFQSDLGFGLGLSKRLAAMIDGKATWLIPAGMEMEDDDAAAIKEVLNLPHGESGRLRVHDESIQYDYAAISEHLAIVLEMDSGASVAAERREILLSAALIGGLILSGISAVVFLVRPLARRLLNQAANLSDSERRLSLAQDAAGVGSFEYDIDRDRIIATRELEKLFGLKPGEFPRNVGEWIEHIHADDRSAIMDRVRDAIERGKPYEGEFRVIHPDRSEHWLHAKGLVYRAPNQQAKMLGVNIDIDRRKRVEQEVQRANQDLEQFASVASHDLQEPLRMVGSYLSLFERKFGGGLDATARGYLSQAKDGADRMQRLVKDLLAFARSSRQEMTLAPVEAADACAEALGNLRPRIEQAQANVTVDPLPVVQAEHSALVRLFQNLLSNAIKYRRPDIPPKVRLAAERSGPSWIFSVADNGIGIPGEHIARIFDPFHRLHSRAEYPGTGLGLAICARLVERMGGAIWVESVEGVGSTFYFRLAASAVALTTDTISSGCAADRSEQPTTG